MKVDDQAGKYGKVCPSFQMILYLVTFNLFNMWRMNVKWYQDNHIMYTYTVEIQ